MKCHLRITTLLLLLTLQAVAQEQFGPSPSPSGSNTNVQNNLFDGTATISIPFFSKQVDGVPISINAVYNTKGIKVDQMASSIGLGWELFTGGSIVRIQHDLPDEEYLPRAYCINPVFLTQALEMPTGSWVDKTGYNIPDAIKDKELDEFVVTLPTGAVKFLIDRSGNVMTIPKTNIQIRRILGSTPITTSQLSIPTNVYNLMPTLKFEIKDQSGNIFTFSPGDYESIPFSEYYPNHSYYNNCNSVPLNIKRVNKWVLENIQTYEGKFIYFSYNTVSLTDVFINNKVNIHHYYVPNPVPNGALINLTEKIEPTKYTGYVSTIQKIEFSDGINVLFQYDNNYRHDVPGTKALTRIVVQDNTLFNSVNHLYYDFNYSYFRALLTNPAQTIQENYPYTGTGSANMIRLKLNSINKSLAGENPKPYYEFTYDMNFMPYRGNPEQDIYGYYNGKGPVDDFGTSISFEYKSVEKISVYDPFNFVYREFGIDKSSDAVHAKALALTKVKNSLGGSTEFVYDDALSPSTFSTVLNGAGGTLKAVDGIRLLEQIDYDGYKNENTIKTKYSYSNAQAFLGNATAKFGYQSVCNGTTINYDVAYNSYMNAFLPVNNSNHGYGKVTEKKYKTPFNQSDQIGRVDHYFSVAQNSSLQVESTVYDVAKTGIPATSILSINELSSSGSSNFFKGFHEPPYTNKQYFKTWQIGLPIETVTYDNNDRKLTREMLKYEVSDPVITPSGSYQNGSNWCTKYLIKTVNCSGTPTNYYVDDYYNVTGRIKLIKKTIESYVSDNDKLTTIVDYQYNTTPGHDMDMRSVATTNSKGETEWTSVYYNYDWTSNAGNALTQLSLENITKPVLTERWRNIGGVNTLLDVQASGFNLINIPQSSGTKQIAVPTHLYEFNRPSQGLTGYTSGPASFNMQTAASGGSISNFNFIGHSLNHSTKGLPYDFITAAGAVNCKFYDTRSRVIAEVTNSSSQDVAYESFEFLFPISASLGQELQGNWSHQQGSIYDLNSVGIPQISGRLAYKLENVYGSPYDDIETYGNLTAGKKYYVTFWIHGSNVPLVKDGNISLPVQQIESTWNGWMQYGVEFTSSGNKISICRGTGNCFIDELRLYPIGARMTT